MKQHCIIVDDEQTARSILRKYIQDTPSLQLGAEFKNAIDALEYLQNQKTDLIFLDIEMPKLSGINFAKIVENKVKIIFTSAHREFALDGFELNAVDYLLKPFSFDRFLKAIRKTAVPSDLSKKRHANTHTFIRVNKQMVKINYHELLYIEGLSNYVKFHTAGKNYTAYEKLSNLSQKLPTHIFRRIHKSYIVNTNKISLYTKEYVEINKKHIPVSSTYRADLLSFLNQ